MAPSPSDPAQNDALLLRCYVREGSEAAFRALAERHLPFIWSTARRIVNGDAALAEDIAQSVLVDFARHAQSLPCSMPAAGWLHRHTVFTAHKFLRSDSRRRARERAAAQMEDAIAPHPESSSELAPHLDRALNRLREQDRRAVLLRYYERRPLREVGRLLGISEEAVRKRLDRAVEKLRRLLSRRGLVPAAGLILLMLNEESSATPAAAVIRRVTSAAWSILEHGPVPASPTRGWWRSRPVAGGAAAFFILSLGVLWWTGDSPPAEAAGRPPSSQSAVRANFTAAGQGAEEVPVTLTATVMILPEADAAPQMVDYTPGHDDAKLYQQFLPKAAALQKKEPPDEILASTGHSLIVLTGPAKVSVRSFSAAGVPGDPFVPPSASLKHSGSYRYPTEFNPPDEKGVITTSEFTFRITGTELEANISPPTKSGARLCEFSLNHMFAAPEELELFSLPNSGGSSSGPGTISQPVFRSVRISSGSLTLEPDVICLAGMTSIPADLFPESDRSPRRLFLFLKFIP